MKYTLLFSFMMWTSPLFAAAWGQQEQDGFLALVEAGFDPDEMDDRSLREAGLLKLYQSAWNDFDPNENQSSNPKKIISYYADDFIYRDTCVPHGLTTPAKFDKYLKLLYTKYPRQVWGDGWSQIHLFKGSKPGEWAYYYNFYLYNSKDTEPALSGTGMERVQFNEAGKLLSDEVHLILSSGQATCKF